MTSEIFKKIIIVTAVIIFVVSALIPEFNLDIYSSIFSILLLVILFLLMKKNTDAVKRGFIWGILSLIPFCITFVLLFGVSGITYVSDYLIFLIFLMFFGFFAKTISKSNSRFISAISAFTLLVLIPFVFLVFINYDTSNIDHSLTNLYNLFGIVLFASVTLIVSYVSYFIIYLGIKSLFQKEKTSKKIFTIVVIAIIVCILSAILMYGQQEKEERSKRFRNSSRWAETNAILSAILQNIVDNEGRIIQCSGTPVYDIPPTETCLGTVSHCCDLTDSLVEGGYLPDVPKDRDVGSNEDTGYTIELRENMVLCVSAPHAYNSDGNGEDVRVCRAIKSAAQDNNEDIACEGKDSCEVVKEYDSDKKTYLIYIKNKETGSKSYFMSIDDIYGSHYHFAEYRNGNLYVIRRIGYDGYPDENWTDELWLYNDSKIGKKLYTNKGIDFKVSPNNRMIVIVIKNELVFISADKGEIIKTISRDVMGNYTKWSDDGQYLWGATGPASRIGEFFRVNTNNFVFDDYSDSELYISHGYDLNANTGVLAYDTYPVFFDVDGRDMFEKSNTEVKLYLYNFHNNGKELIATSIMKSFNPKWIDDETIEYDNPNGERRLIYNLE